MIKKRTRPTPRIRQTSFEPEEQESLKEELEERDEKLE